MNKDLTMPEKLVVIVDDDSEMVSILSRRFTDLGCKVIGTNRALDAMNAIAEVVPAIVCLDVNMPGGNGWSVRELIASDERLSEVPVIMLTGCRDEQTIRRCHETMSYYVEKNANVWQRIEPLAKELLFAAPAC